LRNASVINFLTKVFFRAYTNPISLVPGPWSTRWTGIVAEYHWVMGNRPRYVHILHEKYGQFSSELPKLVF
jgi:hypothetical protein